MTILSQISSGASEPERLVGFLAIAGVGVLAVWKSVRWWLRTQPTPDPWDATVAAELEKDEAVPLCCRCLTAHGALVDFCPHCGAPVGQYTNWLPFPYLFSVGHVLRIGTSGEFKRSPLTIVGFLFLGLAEYMIFVPIYWIVFLRKLLRPQAPGHPPEQTPPATQATIR